LALQLLALSLSARSLSAELLSDVLQLDGRASAGLKSTICGA
jgi:hypothetical protein